MKKTWLFLFLISCGVIKGQQNTAIPDWYLNPPKNDISYLYGTGYGSSIDQATQIALNNVAEKVSVTVSSSVTSEKQESSSNENSLYESQYEQDVSTSVQEMNFTNYETVKSEQVGMHIYSLVKVSRSEIIENYMKQIKKIDNEISAIIKGMSRVSAIEQFARLHRITDKIRVNEINLKIVETIEKSDAGVRKYYDRYQSLLKLKTQIKNKIVVKVIAKPSDENVAMVLTKSINDLNIKTSSKLNPKNKAHALLRVVTSTKHDKIYGTYLAKIKVDMKLLENFGDQISSGFIEISGSSAVNSAGAVDAAIANFRKKIQELGLLQVVGL